MEFELLKVTEPMKNTYKDEYVKTISTMIAQSYDKGVVDGKQLGKIECAATHFKPDWQLMAREVKDASEEAYLAGHSQALKEVGKWLRARYKSTQINDLKGTHRITFALTDEQLQAIEEGRIP